MRNKCLWASDLRAMNDHTELSYAEDLLVRGIERIDAEAARAVVPALLSEMDAIRPLNLFSVSFSMHPELKSQWVDYAKKDGVCIGFPMEIFETAVERDRTLLLDEVVYDRRAQAFLLEPLMRRIIAHGADVTDRRRFAGFLSSEIAPGFAEVAPFLKHPGMFEEREVRLVCQNPQRVLTRMRKGKPVRYTEVPYRRYFYDTPQVDFLFERVYAAPRRAGYMERLREIDGLLTRKRVRFSSIMASQVPYEFD